jgi:hypothetical protein
VVGDNMTQGEEDRPVPRSATGRRRRERSERLLSRRVGERRRRASWWGEPSPEVSCRAARCVSPPLPWALAGRRATR